MSDITFYTNPQSRGRIVHWLLEELAEPYDTEWIDYGEQMKGAEYLAVNPMGKVPAIKHRGAVVTETPAICTYLAVSYPDKDLIPAHGDPALADFYRWMFFAAGPAEMAVTTRSMGWELAEDKQRSVGFGSHGDTMDALELALGKGPYVCGENFTAVDVYLGSALIWGMMFGTMEKRPAFEKYTADLAARPASQRANQINEDRIKSLED